MTTFSSVVAASVFNEVKNDVVGLAFVIVGMSDDKIELAEVDAVVVVVVVVVVFVVVVVTIIVVVALVLLSSTYMFLA